MQPNGVHQEIQRLRCLLDRQKKLTLDERSKVAQLAKELDETKAQLKKENQAKRQLERALRFSNPKTDTNAKLVSQVQSTIKQKKDYEDLQEAYKVKEEKMAAELQVERQRTKALHKQMDSIGASTQELCAKHQNEVLALKQENQALRQRLDQQVKSHANKLSQDLQTINLLRAEQHVLHQRLAEGKRAEEKHKALQKEVERQKIQLEEMSLNQQLMAHNQETEECWSPPRKMRRLQQKEETSVEAIQLPQQQKSVFTNVQLEDALEQDSISAFLQYLEALDVGPVCEESHTRNNNKASVTKINRHFLGVRNPRPWRTTKN